MNRRSWVLLAATLAIPTAGAALTQQDPLTQRAQEIHNRVITLDTHCDIPNNFAHPDGPDPGVRGNRQVDIPKMVEGGLNVAFFIVYVGQGPRTAAGNQRAQEQAMSKFTGIRRMAYELHPDKIALAYSPDDVVRIHREGKLVACIGIENGYVIGRDIGLIARYHELGARYFGLVHNGHNDIADSCNPRGGEPREEHGGLSEFGRQVVAEVNRVGLMVDVSHASKNASIQAMQLSRAPLIASHSSVWMLARNSRNMDDETLEALKENGGVIQICALSGFVNTERRATVADFVNHIDYVARRIGIDHVAIASDFDGGGGITGWNDASETLNVTLELVRRGYSEEEIGKIWSGNTLRVWREVERIAGEIQAEEAAAG